MDVFWGSIVFLVGLGSVVYFTKRFGKLATKDFLYALLGGLGFTASWMMISLLLDVRPQFFFPILGGIALFFGLLSIRAILKRKHSD